MNAPSPQSSPSAGRGGVYSKIALKFQIYLAYRLPVCVEKAPPCGGDESARNEISILIAGMHRAVRGEHHCICESQHLPEIALCDVNKKQSSTHGYDAKHSKRPAGHLLYLLHQVFHLVREGKIGNSLYNQRKA